MICFRPDSWNYKNRDYFWHTIERHFPENPREQRDRRVQLHGGRGFHEQRAEIRFQQEFRRVFWMKRPFKRETVGDEDGQ